MHLVSGLTSSDAVPTMRFSHPLSPLEYDGAGSPRCQNSVFMCQSHFLLFVVERGLEF
jgi:hypothetical protein